MLLLLLLLLLLLRLLPTTKVILARVGTGGGVGRAPEVAVTRALLLLLVQLGRHY